MNEPNNRKTQFLLWGMLALPVLWLAAALAQATEQGGGLAEMATVLSTLLANPLALHWCKSTLKYVLMAAILYPLCIAYYYLEQEGRHPGAEYGTAKWGKVTVINRRFCNTKDPQQNYILTMHIQLGMDVFRTRMNLNVVVIGGSGAGKTRFYAKPNLMQCACSYLILDPKGELVRDLGHLYEAQGIAVTVIDLVHFKGHYNPMAYLETDEDAIKLAHAIVNNTKPKDAPASGDKFWDDSASLLISAIILFLMYEAPVEEQNFSTLMYLIANCQQSEESSDPNPLEMLFDELEERDPEHPAVLQFHSFKLGSTKTLQSVLITAASNLYMFNSRRFAEMTNRDETFLPRLGLEKRAVFCVIPDNDTTYNFLVTMLYSQLFDQLFRLADSEAKYRGALPVHVRLMMDEFANVALPQNFKNILSVCRSRNISCDIILQNVAQLKGLFKDEWEGVLGNCDTMIYLGGNEYGTFEYLSKILGKETERTKSQSIGKGSRGSSSESHQAAGRELQTPDEIRRLDNSKALLLMRSQDPVIDDKYDILKHPNVRFTPDGGGEPYTMPYDYAGKMMQSVTTEELATVQPDKIPNEILKRFELIDMEENDNEQENLQQEQPQPAAEVGGTEESQENLLGGNNGSGNVHGDGDASLRGRPADHN